MSQTAAGAAGHSGGKPHADARGGSSHSAGASNAGASVQQPHHAGGEGASRNDGKNHGGQSHGGRGRDRRKKNRAGRGLQGRPLTQAKGALNGVSQPALTRAMSSSEQGNSITPALQSVEATLPFHDDLYAALDLGTNNCRLLIAQPTRPGHFRVVDAFSRIVRLGEGLAATGRLSNDAMDRAVEALRICALKLAAKPIRKMRLIATEACRAAANGEEFLARVTAETGLELEIIDRETEARLAVSGCSSLVGREARSIVLFDIGGGSSEIAVIRIADNRSSRLANHITHWTSLPVGVVTLSERYGGRDVTPDVFEAMICEVQGMLAKFDCPPPEAVDNGSDYDFHLIGTSGTVTTLAGVHLDLPRYDRRRVDGLWLSDAEVTAMQAKLLSWDFAGRAANPCIGPDRADLVLAGCAILEAIRRRWPSPRMRVADRGLREGLLTDMMADDGVWRRIRSRRSGSTGSGEVLRRR
ncbi:exopolyphosphatase/guanosine-5'-triphosphate,3'-diphosphate pyrophosphatase [Rhizobium wenxiniae]|uniref:Exopolyphosphatase/guanosine-5'-triphosphate, 3'-diphosphate pyrophosphatase n=2 Tax=Rhizobium/Agrobacterium group TaxID=227290 RepID=A0A7W9Y630_9HYPH|nr:exopolyphosphatase/guanosine-5'-triphosphate,3'-diphosphate pyrophosphatase [Rhizobium wenxiniae]